MLKINWTEKVANEAVLVHVKETMNILKTTWHRKHRCQGIFSGMRTYSTTLYSVSKKTPPTFLAVT